MTKIVISHCITGVCSLGCSFSGITISYDGNSSEQHCKLGAATEGDEKNRIRTLTFCRPGPDCPGPGTYELRKAVTDDLDTYYLDHAWTDSRREKDEEAE